MHQYNSLPLHPPISNPETLRGLTDFDPSIRDTELNEMLNGYKSLVLGILNVYDSGMDMFNISGVGSQKLYMKRVYATRNAAKETLHDVNDRIIAVMDAYTQSAIESLGQDDQSVLSSLVIDGATIDVQFLKEDIGRASCPQAQQAIAAVVDQVLMQQARRWVMEGYDISEKNVRETIEAASSEPVQQAIKASLDGILCDMAHDAAAQFHGTDNEPVRSFLESMSTTAVGRVVDASLDAFRVERVLWVAGNLQSAEHHWVKRALGEMYSSKVREAIMGLLHHQYTAGNAQTTNPESSTGAESKYSTKLSAVKAILGKYTNDSEFMKGRKWMSDIKPETVLRILNTAQALRDKATEDGRPEPADSVVYRKYRLLAERNMNNPEHYAHESVVVIDALMKGDHKNGSLPRL